MATSNAIVALLQELGVPTESIGTLTATGVATVGSLVSQGALSGTTLTTTGAVGFGAGNVTTSGTITGGAITGTSLSPTNGTLTRIQFGVTGSITGAGGTATVTHGLGATPTAVILTPGFASAAGCGCATSLGTTTFVVTNEATATGVYYWLAVA